MIKIWGRASSQNVQKVLWCCDEIDVQFDRIDWGGTFGGNDEPSYRAKNPTGRVPTIDDNGSYVWESNSILRYLCVRFNASKLYPVDPLARSMVERWMDWQLSVLNPPMVTMLLGYYRTAEEKRDKAALENARQQAIQQWSIVEGQLKDRSFLTGDAFTLADIGNGILAHRWHSYPIERPNFPNLKRWYERLQDRPGFKSHIAGPIS